MGGRGRGSGAGAVGGGGVSGGGGGSRRTSGGGGWGSGGAAGSPIDPAELKRLQAAVERSRKRIPESVRTMLEKQGVKLAVISNPKEAARGLRGSYSPGLKRAQVVAESFRHANGPRNAGMTGLHELGHAVDYLHSARGTGLRVSETKEFRTALAKDLKSMQNRKLTAAQKSGLTYQHYSPKKRAREVFAEGFAVTHGPGRPAPGKNLPWNSSRTFKRVYPNVVEYLKGLK